MSTWTVPMAQADWYSAPFGSLLMTKQGGGGNHQGTRVRWGAGVWMGGPHVASSL